jgi:RimJ/RimL family protein N-acetyltransferase
MAGIRYLDKSNWVTINYIINELLKPEVHQVLFDDFWGIGEIAGLMYSLQTVIYSIHEKGKPEPIGCVYFSNVIPYRDCTLSAVIFDPEKRNKGIMTKSDQDKLALVKIIENDMRKRFSIHSCTSYVTGDNEGSKRLLERLGFEKLGVKKRVIFSGGEYKDITIYYRLLEGEEGE